LHELIFGLIHFAEDFVVPLELPALDPKQAVPPPIAEGVTPADDLTEEEQKKLEAVGWRMLNLPLIVCHSANGMPFFFPLQKVNTCPMSFHSPLIQEQIDRRLHATSRHVIHV